MNGWLIVLAVLVGLAVLPLGASVIYDKDGPLVRIIAGPVKLKVFPTKKKLPKNPEQQAKEAQKQQEKKSKKEQKKAANPSKENKRKPEAEDPQGGSILDFWPFVELGLNFLGDFRRKLRVNHLGLRMTMAGDDPCDLAVNYGRANAAMGTLLSQLDQLFVIKRQAVQVNCDFTADETVIWARLDLTITLGRLIALVVGYGVRALTTYLSIQKKRKGGAEL